MSNPLGDNIFDCEINIKSCIVHISFTSFFFNYFQLSPILWVDAAPCFYRRRRRRRVILFPYYVPQPQALPQPLPQPQPPQRRIRRRRQ